MTDETTPEDLEQLARSVAMSGVLGVRDRLDVVDALRRLAACPLNRAELATLAMVPTDATTEPTWTRARLIPVSGIGSEKEAETRAASAVLAVFSVVRDLSLALFAPMGASRAGKATVETYTEPQFSLGGKKIRPDGLVRISYGKAEWTALVEFKTGDAKLDPEQINTYWELARQHNFDAVVTISNEIAASPGSHPTEGLRVRSNSKVQIHHISWTALLSTAVMIKSHKGVADPEQAWLVGELIRYLEHSASGAMAFDDMGPNWVAVRDGARDGALRKTDDGVQDVALRWDQLLRYAALQLGARIGSDVQHVLSRAQTDQKARLAYLVDSLAVGRPLDGVLRVPNTVGDIEVYADVKARRITACVSVNAPEDRGGRARCTWIVGQLRDAPNDLIIEAYPKNARTPHTASLAQVLEDRDVLLGDDKREPTRFRLVWTREMGANRKAGSRKPGFIDSVLSLIESFYGSVVQNVTPWTPKAPKITRSSSAPASVDDDDEDQGTPNSPPVSEPSPEPPLQPPTPTPWETGKS